MLFGGDRGGEEKNSRLRMALRRDAARLGLNRRQGGPKSRELPEKLVKKGVPPFWALCGILGISVKTVRQTGLPEDAS